MSRAEMLFSKGVILVEGAAELFLLPAMAELRVGGVGEAINLDRYGITVCSVHGTDFAPYWRLLGESGLNLPCVIITDGDLKDEKTGVHYLGLDRGVRLLPDSIRTTAESLLLAHEWDDVRRMLAENDIYVGEKTLELDVLNGYADAMKKTYREIRGSDVAANNFDESVDGALSGDPSADSTVMNRIGEIGKGRFGQRLAENVTNDELPDYLAAGIDSILEQVKESWME